MVKNITLKEELSHRILCDIMDGRFNKNDLITEAEIMNIYASSKSTARESLIKLCQQNVIESLPRKGYRIKPLSFKDIFQIVEVRVELETFALRKAFPNIMQDDISRIEEHEKKCIQEVAENAESYTYSKYWDNNKAFHLMLSAKCDNDYILAIITELICHCARYVPQYYTNAWSHERELMSGELHVQIIGALKEHDLNKAVQLLEKDILSFKNELISDIVKEEF